ncbi:MAG: M23 family peptidase [Ruminococcaceae bacterium]|nr:M23 family peptidase [Oscillospiraceae bacterium]
MSNLHLLSNKPKKNNSKGFYIALGVCLIAIGVAAWTTYDSVVNYASPNTVSSSSEAQKTNQTLSGVTVKEPEPSSVVSAEPEPSSSTPSSEPVPSKPAVSSPKPKSSKPTAKPANASVTSFQYPVGNAVTQPFSGENPVYNKTMKDWRAHTGVDIAAKEGDTIKAAAYGTVKDVIADDTLGNMVVIMHGDVETYYCGMGQTTVKKGETVKQGQEIGTLGVVPCESQDEPHLHLAMKRNGKYIDPATMLKK